MMKRLSRYVFGEILGPLALGFLVYTFILLMQFFFQSAEMIIRRDVPAAMVGQLFALNLPHIVVLTIPMSLLFGILIAIGRLSADSELVAMRACGISLFSLYGPVLLLSLLLTVANAYLTIYVLPWGNQHLQQLRLDIITRSISQEVRPRVFYEEWDDRTLYVFEIPPGQRRWRGVFLSQSIPGTENKVTVADWGEVLVDEEGEQIVLHLENSIDLEVDLDDPGESKVAHHGDVDLLLEEQFLTNQRAKLSVSKSIRELTLPQLRRWSVDRNKSPAERRLALVERQKRFAIPVACFVLGLFAVPLGFNNRHGGRASGFAISIVVILVYYILLSNGEEAAAQGRFSPWIAMWAPNALFFCIGIVLLARKNRDKGLWLPSSVRALGRRAWTKVRYRWGSSPRPPRRRIAGADASRVHLRLPRPRIRFPNLFDRYVMGVFSRVFVLVLVAGMVVYVIADFTEIVDQVLKNKITSDVVMSYYKYFSLQIFYLIAPVVVLITTLITFSLLSRTSEITAAKAVGWSLFRLALPTLVAALLVVGVSILLESAVLPASNARVAELRAQIRGEERVRTYRRADRQWLFGRGGYLYNYIHYDPEPRLLQRLQVFQFDERYRLTGHLYAATAHFDKGQWWVQGGWARNFDGVKVTRYEPLPGPVPVDIPEAPEFFDTEVKSPEEMNYSELRRYIGSLVAGGQSVPELEVELHNKIAMPFVCLVMALVALPFAFRIGKRGALYGLGLSLVLGMVFYALVAIFGTLGEAGDLPPLVAAWSPNLLFAIFSLYLFLGVRT